MIVERVEKICKDRLVSNGRKAYGHARVTARTFISIKPPIGGEDGYWAVPLNLPIRQGIMRDRCDDIFDV